MHLIKVNAIDSTNSFGREMLRQNPQLHPTCISAKDQLKGRGQRGNHWNSKPGQNLTFSIVWPKPGVSLSHQFLISALVATSIVKTLEGFNIPKLKLKWPNDIMSAKYKIGGILIENNVSEGKLTACIIGIGLNVNQTDFTGLPHASSLKLATGSDFCTDELLERLVGELESELEQLTDLNKERILADYRSRLFRKNIPSTFRLEDNSFITGIIENVSLSGKLLVRTENEVLREFDLKEVKLCF